MFLNVFVALFEVICDATFLKSASSCKSAHARKVSLSQTELRGFYPWRSPLFCIRFAYLKGGGWLAVGFAAAVIGFCRSTFGGLI